MGTGALLRGLKQPGREVNHSSPSSAEAINEWRYNSLPRVHLRDADGENFRFIWLLFKLMKFMCLDTKPISEAELIKLT
jgi:hypothetical protein